MRKPPPNARALPFDEWPELDRNAWREAQSEGNDLLDEYKPAARWRKSSRELFVRCYALWLAWLRDEGLLNPDEPPGDRVTEARLSAYLRAQRQLGSEARTLVNHATGLRHMFEALDPSRDWRSLMLPAIKRLKQAVKTNRNHSDLPSIRELFSLGLALMKNADARPDLTVKQRAVVFRNGLAIAILACRPLMRRNNLCTLRLGRQLVKVEGAYELRFTGDEMKGRRSRGGPLPAMLTPVIERYLAVHRPALLAAKRREDGKEAREDEFFVSGLGNGIYPHAFSNEIGRVTYAFFGRRVCFHEFRHAAASSIAREDPGHVGIVPSILGHADYRVSEAHYVFAEEHAAFGRLSAAVDVLCADERKG